MSFTDFDSYLSQDVSVVDPEIARLLRAELDRQSETLEMIASENFTSQAVLQAVGSVLTNKYAEGLPGKRYYGGCEVVDEVEQLAIDRAKAVFGAEHANVQPHSGLDGQRGRLLRRAEAGRPGPGDGAVARRPPLARPQGQLLGGLYEFQPLRRAARRLPASTWTRCATWPASCARRLIVAGASAYPRIIDFAAFREIADEVGALLMVDMAHIAGLVAAGVHPTPVGIADLVTTTTTRPWAAPGRASCMSRRSWRPRSTRPSSRASRAAR